MNNSSMPGMHDNLTDHENESGVLNFDEINSMLKMKSSDQK